MEWRVLPALLATTTIREDDYRRSNRHLVSHTDRKQGVESESAILVGVELPQRRHGGDEHAGDLLDELAGLVETANAEIVGRLSQKLPAPNHATYLGKGKVERLATMVKATDADVVIFDNDLSPAQTRNLETACGVKVLDRTEVILDIFSTRAQTHEARLAVELAQLEYSLPRLKRMWTHLSRLKMGVGMRGPGEKQLETDRRLVEKRINDLRNQLKKIERRRERQVAARRDHMTVSLVGYTNAGKSTLMNALTDADVVAQDKLFATLDTRTRRWQLPGWGPVLLSDTVGFIRDLPHHLIASFKATLEEARQADLLLHVADANSPAAMDQIAAVFQVLRELGIEEKDTLLVLNKVDRLGSGHMVEKIHHRYPSAIPISARSGEGLSRLANAVSDALSQHFLDVDVDTGVDNGRVQAYLARHGEILSRTFAGNRVTVHCRIPRKYLGRLKDADVDVRPHGGPADLTENEAGDSAARKSDGHIEDVA